MMLRSWLTSLTRPSRRRSPAANRQAAAWNVSIERVEDRTLLSGFATYLGGSGAESGQSVVFDAGGNAFVIGQTAAPDFPTTAGALDVTHNGGDDIFVSKFSPSGSLIWSTLLGGSGNETAKDLVVDAAGNVYITGSTNSGDFPTTAGAFQSVHKGGGDAFVAKLDASGATLLYSTYIGGGLPTPGAGGTDTGQAITVDVAGNAYVTGITDTTDFPTTAGAFQTTIKNPGGFIELDAFVLKLNPTGTSLIYSTYLGGSNRDFGGDDIVIDAAGNATVVGGTFSSDFPTTPGVLQPGFAGGADGFVTKLNASGTGLIFSTYLGGGGGPGSSFGERVSHLAVDAAGDMYLTGRTGSSNFPTTPGAFQTSYGGGTFDAYVAKINANATSLLFSTFLGGSGSDDNGLGAGGIGIDAAGNVTIASTTSSANFPTTAGALQTILNGPTDAFYTTLNPSLSALVVSSYLGGSGSESGRKVAVDSSGAVYLTGSTDSADFPVTAGAHDTTANGSLDAFVVKIGGTPNSAPTMTLLGVDETAIFENESVTLDGTFTDPDVGDEHTVTITWGDGTIQVETLTIGDRTFSFSHTFLDDGSSPGNGTPSDDYTILVTISDDSGASDSSGSGGSGGWTQLTPLGTAPAPRNTHSTVYDPISNTMILFGGRGGPSDSTLFNDVWRLTDANGDGTPQWVQVAPSGPIPQARWVHQAEYDPDTDTMIVHAGGLGFSSPCSNQTWILSNAATGAATWTNLINSGPAPRFGHSAVHDSANDRMTVFAGSNCFSSPSFGADVWVLNNAAGIGAPSWTQLFPTGSITDRASHMAEYDPSSNRMIVFGGGNNSGSPVVFNDVHVLTNANGLGGTPQWINISPTSGPAPTPRLGMTSVYDADDNRLVVFGGSDSVLRNDVWVLNHANGLGGTPEWVELTPTAGPMPPPVSSHSMTFDAANDRIMVFGGRRSAGSPANYGNEVWTFDLQTSVASPTVTVTNVAPVAADQTYATDEDTPLALNVLAGSDDSGPFSVSDQGTLDTHTAVAGTFATTEGGSVTIAANGAATYTPAADFFGTDTFTYTAVDDDTGAGIGTVTINVIPINNPPQFVAGPDQTVAEDSGSHTVPGWATGISAGPANESGQVLTFLVDSNTNPALFSGGPAVDPISGDLTFTTAVDASGSATIGVRLMDDGGTANGGDDDSAVAFFTITVESAAEQIDGLIDAVELLNNNGTLNNGQANPPLNFLDQALKDLSKGKVSQAIHKLNSFIDRIQDLIDDGTLTVSEGQPLIDIAEAAILSALPGSPLRVAATGTLPGGMTERLQPSALKELSQQAAAYWTTESLTESQRATLDGLTIHVVELPRDYLGFASSTDIWVDSDAGGYGWSTNAKPASPQPTGVDLLSVLVHEFGHAIGLTHSEGNGTVLAEFLSPGVRTVPSPPVVTTASLPLTRTDLRLFQIRVPLDLEFRVSPVVYPSPLESTVLLAAASFTRPALSSLGRSMSYSGAGSMSRVSTQSVIASMNPLPAQQSDQVFANPRSTPLLDTPTAADVRDPDDAVNMLSSDVPSGYPSTGHEGRLPIAGIQRTEAGVMHSDPQCTSVVRESGLLAMAAVAVGVWKRSRTRAGRRARLWFLPWKRRDI